MKNGFTLIELLVAILIIGVLAAVALPQYQKAVEKSRAAEMLVLERQFVAGGENYLLHNGHFNFHGYIDGVSRLFGIELGPDWVQSGTRSCNDDFMAELDVSPGIFKYKIYRRDGLSCGDTHWTYKYLLLGTISDGGNKTRTCDSGTAQGKVICRSLGL